MQELEKLPDTVSMAALMIRAQSKQIRRMTVDEYIREKTGSGADGQEDT